MKTYLMYRTSVQSSGPADYSTIATATTTQQHDMEAGRVPFSPDIGCRLRYGHTRQTRRNTDRTDKLLKREWFMHLQPPSQSPDACVARSATSCRSQIRSSASSLSASCGGRTLCFVQQVRTCLCGHQFVRSGLCYTERLNTIFLSTALAPCLVHDSWSSVGSRNISSANPYIYDKCIWSSASCCVRHTSSPRVSKRQPGWLS